MVKNLFAVAAFAAMLPMGAAHGQPVIQSQEGIALENQILQLQQQVQQMQSGGNGGSSLGTQSAPPPAAAPQGGLAANGSVVTQLLNQVNQLQSQVQQLNGQVDTLQNQVNTQHNATEKEIGDLNFKVSNGGAPGGGPNGGPGAPQNPGNGGNPGDGNMSNSGPQMAPPPQAPAPAQNAAAMAAPATPRAALHAAQAAYARHDYATAVSLSHSILSTAKSSPEAYQAQFLLAQSLSGQGKPQEAAIAYDDAYNRNRTGAEAPQALLGLAVSLSEIHQNEAACDTLSSLNSQFPSPTPGMQSRIDAASHRAHCS
jgi:TolA-binding protein